MQSLMVFQQSLIPWNRLKWLKSGTFGHHSWFSVVSYHESPNHIKQRHWCILQLERIVFQGNICKKRDMTIHRTGRSRHHSMTNRRLRLHIPASCMSKRCTAQAMAGWNSWLNQLGPKNPIDLAEKSCGTKNMAQIHGIVCSKIIALSRALSTSDPIISCMQVSCRLETKPQTIPAHRVDRLGMTS